MRPRIQSAIRTFSLYAFLLILPFGAFAQPKDSLRVLFVGNSFTFFWNLPQIVGAMAESQGIPMLVRQSTASGATLEQHWKGEKGLATKSLIQEGKWDLVVIQNHSTSAIDQPEAFREFGKKFAELARSAGAEPLFFNTWAYHSNPLQQPAITEAYYSLAKALGADVAPVGQIWSEARKSRPDLNMFFDDKHPSPEGAYLTGLIFFKKLTGRPVTGISNRLLTTDKNGEKLYLSILSEENAAFFRQLVETFPFPPSMPDKK